MGWVSTNLCAPGQRMKQQPCLQALLLSSPPALPDAGSNLCFWGAQALAEFQPDRHTSTPPGTWRSPTYLGSAPQPWGSTGIQVHMPQAGWDGARERGWGYCLVIWGCHWQRCRPGMPLSPGELLSTHPILLHSVGFLADGCSAFF